MRKRGKKYNEAVAKLEKGKLYTKEEACKLVKVLLKVRVNQLEL